VRVDNRPCFGAINPVTVVGRNPDTKCGFLEYLPGDKANISFGAGHPADFASFVFIVTRVSTTVAAATAAGLVEAISVNGFQRTGATFSKDIVVTELLKDNLPLNQYPPAPGRRLPKPCMSTPWPQRL